MQNVNFTERMLALLQAPQYIMYNPSISIFSDLFRTRLLKWVQLVYGIDIAYMLIRDGEDIEEIFNELIKKELQRRLIEGAQLLYDMLFDELDFLPEYVCTIILMYDYGVLVLQHS